MRSIVGLIYQWAHPAVTYFKLIKVQLAEYGLILFSDGQRSQYVALLGWFQSAQNISTTFQREEIRERGREINLVQITAS